MTKVVTAVAFGAAAIGLFPAAHAQAPIERQLPCEAYSQSAAVFVGVASAPVKRWVQLEGHGPIELKLTPIEVERAYLGVTTAVMYLTPLGVEYYAIPGERYLVYGRHYQPPDIVMATPGVGAKQIGSAAADLAFLDALPSDRVGGTIAGIVQQDQITYDRKVSVHAPLEGIPVRIFNDTHSIEAISSAGGQFVASGLAAGLYEVIPTLPEGLVVRDPTSKTMAIVRDGGCATVDLVALFNGCVRGVLRGPDGKPLPLTSVDLMPMDVKPDPTTGHINGTGSVSTNDRGEFEFTGRPAGRYYLGVGLYLAPNSYAPSYPRTYYPGTTDRASATPIVVKLGEQSDGFDFSIASILAKGELEVIVENDRPGQLKLCVMPLENLFGVWSSYAVQAGVPFVRPVVDGQAYQVHVHLDYPDGHLESEPYIFTAGTGKTTVRLRPDAPRSLHR